MLPAKSPSFALCMVQAHFFDDVATNTLRAPDSSAAVTTRGITLPKAHEVMKQRSGRSKFMRRKPCVMDDTRRSVLKQQKSRQ